MTDSPSKVIRQLLLDLGLDWPVSYDSELDKPDNVVTVYDTQEQMDSDGMQGQVVHNGIQVRVRAATSDAGRLKAQWIRQAFNDVYEQGVTVNTSFYLVHAIAGGTILKLGKDGSTTRRSLFVVNCRASIKSTDDAPAPPVSAYGYFPSPYF